MVLTALRDRQMAKDANSVSPGFSCSSVLIATIRLAA
jgi:hypothetical protein